MNETIHFFQPLPNLRVISEERHPTTMKTHLVDGFPISTLLKSTWRTCLSPPFAQLSTAPCSNVSLPKTQDGQIVPEKWCLGSNDPFLLGEGGPIFQGQNACWSLGWGWRTLLFKKSKELNFTSDFSPALRIIGPSKQEGVWPCIYVGGFWDLQTTSFENPMILRTDRKKIFQQNRWCQILSWIFLFEIRGPQ